MKKVEEVPYKNGDRGAGVGGDTNFEKRNVKEMKKRQAEDNGEREGWSQLKRLGEPYPITSDRCTPTGSWGR